MKTGKLDKARKGGNPWTFGCTSNKKIDRQKHGRACHSNLGSPEKLWTIPLTVASHLCCDYLVINITERSVSALQSSLQSSVFDHTSENRSTLSKNFEGFIAILPFSARRDLR